MELSDNNENLNEKIHNILSKIKSSTINEKDCFNLARGDNVMGGVKGLCD